MQIITLAALLLLAPMAVGGLVAGAADEKMQKGMMVAFRWVSGQIILWAGFQVICVPMILARQKFRGVVALFSGYMAVMALLAIAAKVRRHLGKGRASKRLEGSPRKRDTAAALLWACAAALLLLQLVQAVRMTYMDGDDAYYVAVSTITESADSMYLSLAYTGGYSDVDIRHGLAPFPIWIAFLSHVSGIRTVSTAHVALPLALIPLAYAVYCLLGGRLFAGKKRYLPLFLVFTELLVLFGDNSIYTVENFMLARSRQGKAVLGSILLPMLFFLLLLLMERLSEQKKSGAAYWFLLCCTMTAGCLCSTLGTFLAVVLTAVTGLCAAVSYRQWKALLPMALCCVPCVCFALLYLTF